MKERFVIEIETDEPFTNDQINEIKSMIINRMGGYSVETPKFLKGNDMFLNYELNTIGKRDSKIDEILS